MSRPEPTDLGQKPTGIGELSTLLEDHLRLPEIPEQFASQTDAHLVVEGKHLPVHTALLAVNSPLFSDLFMTATQDRAAAASANKVDSLCVPMTGHTLRDTCATLKFLYQRSALDLTETPSKQLWKSLANARVIIKFAHKFYMKGILKECDSCLAAKAQEEGERKHQPLQWFGKEKAMFSNNEDVVAWAALAEEYGLSKLLATAELYMVKTADSAFWQSQTFAEHRLSQACFMRLLRGAQYHASSLSHICRAQKPNPAMDLSEKCSSQHAPHGRAPPHHGWCIYCHPPPAGDHASISQMVAWQ